MYLYSINILIVFRNKIFSVCMSTWIISAFRRCWSKQQISSASATTTRAFFRRNREEEATIKLRSVSVFKSVYTQFLNLAMNNKRGLCFNIQPNISASGSIKESSHAQSFPKFLYRLKQFYSKRIIDCVLSRSTTKAYSPIFSSSIIHATPIEITENPTTHCIFSF